MMPISRRRLALALLFSLLLHLGLLIAPGGYLPASDDDLSSESPSFLDARLAPGSLRQSDVPIIRPLPPKRKPRLNAAQAPAPPASASEAPVIEPPPVPPGLSPAEPAAPIVPPPNSPGAPPLNPAEALPPNSAGASPESALPRQGRIRFAISRGDQGFVIGQSLHRWSHDGTRYTLSNVTETTGIAALFRPVRVMQASEGEIGVAGLRPGKFRTERDGVAGDSASFDWTGMKLTLSAGQREVPLANGAQDLLSMFYQISAVFPWPLHEIDEIMVATGRKFERYAFVVLGEESVATKQGEMRALHLHSAAGVEAIDIWAALDLHGLPLKIRYTDRQGERFDQIADDIELDGKPVTARSR